MSQDNAVEILETLLISVKQRGYKKTLSLLKTDTNSLVPLGDFELFVLESVCQEFKLQMQELIENRYERGDNKYAVGFCVHHLYSKFTLGEIQKRVFRNKTKTLLSKYRSQILDLEKNSKVGEIKKVIEIKNKLDIKIAGFTPTSN